MLEKLKNYLIRNQLKISLAESCTGGLVSSFITNISGASKFFEQSYVTYSNSSKVRLLGVNPNTMAEEGSVSAEVAQEMAVGLVERYADIGLATTGILGPTGGSLENPVGTIYIGLAQKTLTGIESKVVKYRSKQTTRMDIKRDFTKKAIEHLCKFLELELE